MRNKNAHRIYSAGDFLFQSLGIYKNPDKWKFLFLGFAKGIPLAGSEGVLRMQIMLLRHTSKGTVGDQKGTFLDHRGILPAEVCPLTLNANKKISLDFQVMSEANFLDVTSTPALNLKEILVLYYGCFSLKLGITCG